MRITMKKQTLLLLALISSPVHVAGMSIRRHITETIEQAIVKEVEEVKNNQTQTEIAPALTTEVSQAVKERQKQVQSLALFIASKQSIRTVSGALNRSIKPMEKLLHHCFALYDFHRHQLHDMKQSLQELIALLRKHEPTLVESLFSMLSDPRFAKLMQELGERDVTNPNQFRIQHEQLRPLLEEFSAKLESMEQDFIAWGKKWKPAFEKLAPYIAARSKDHQEYFQQAMGAFSASMIWQHMGPALGLAIKSWWHMRKIQNINESGPQLVAATYSHAMQNQEALKQEIHAAFEKILTNCEGMFRRIFAHAYSRSPR